MASINEINFEDISSINGANISISSGAATDFTSWTVGQRPDGGDLSEGDFAVDTTHGRGYRWDATVGALLPIDVYGSTISMSARVVGNESSASALDNFTASETGTGVIVYNGTDVTLDGGNTNNQAALIPDQTLVDANFDNTKNLYWRVVCARGTSSTNINFGFLIRDGSDEMNLRVFSSNPWRRVRSTNYSNVINTSLTDDAPFQTGDTSTHVVEMYVKRDPSADICFAIVDGKTYHLSAFDQGSNSATTDKINAMFSRGYNSSSDNCDMIVYESTFCIW